MSREKKPYSITFRIGQTLKDFLDRKESKSKFILEAIEHVRQCKTKNENVIQNPENCHTNVIQNHNAEKLLLKIFNKVMEEKGDYLKNLLQELLNEKEMVKLIEFLERIEGH